jgi:AraC-like DNA-binding protein
MEAEPMISLEHLLEGLDVRIGRVTIQVVRRDVSSAYGHSDEPTIHYGVRGIGRLETPDGVSVRVSPLSVIVTPPRQRTRVVLRRGMRGEVVVACLRIQATYHGSLGLFDHLREPLVERLGADDPISRSLDDLVEEVHARRPGHRAMSNALLRRTLICLLRRCYEREDCRLRWLAPLEDTRLARALSAMQDDPQHCFRLPELAELAGMSRSVFAARFAQAVGQPPIEFLKAVRLARAAALLARTNLPVKGVAARVGYASRSSFTRAFSACHGLAPAVFRTAGQHSEANVA